jgi:serine/threonine protein kinase
LASAFHFIGVTMAKLLNNRYRILQTLGNGGCGETFLAEDTHMPSLRKCVIKHLKPATRDPATYKIIKQRFEREAAILEMSSQLTVQIPTLHAYFTENHEFYLVQDWIEGKDLARLIAETGSLTEPEVRDFLISILKVLDVIHAQGIIHRDLKPANIIRREKDNLPILIDFGAVKEVLNTGVAQDGSPVTTTLVIGSLHYMAPEQTLGHPVFASDLYALGLTTIFMLTAKTPPEWKVAGASSNAWQPFAPNVSPALMNTLNKAISPETQERFASAREMLQALDLHDTMIGPPPPVFGSAPVKHEEIDRGFQPSVLVILALNSAILLIFLIGFYNHFSEHQRKVESDAASRIASQVKEQAASSASLKQAIEEQEKTQEALVAGEIYRVVQIGNNTEATINYKVLNENGIWVDWSIGSGKTNQPSLKNQGIIIKFVTNPKKASYEWNWQQYTLAGTPVIGHKPTDTEKNSADRYHFDKKLTMPFFLDEKSTFEIVLYADKKQP